MHGLIQQVLEFHKKYGCQIGDPRKPSLDGRQVELRVALLEEELEELKLAVAGKDKEGNDLTPEEQIVAVADALADLSYVTAGAAVAFGIELGFVVDEVHRSNMTKEGQVRQDGKILKGSTYEPPDISAVLKKTSEDYTEAFESEEPSSWYDMGWAEPTEPESVH